MLLPLRWNCALAVLVLLPALGLRLARADDTPDTIHLRASDVPSEFKFGPADEAHRLVIDAFRKKYPWIDPLSTAGIVIGNGSRAYEMIAMMQIAGDIAPDVLYVNF